MGATMASMMTPGRRGEQPHAEARHTMDLADVGDAGTPAAAGRAVLQAVSFLGSRALSFGRRSTRGGRSVAGSVASRGGYAPAGAPAGAPASAPAGGFLGAIQPAAWASSYDAPSPPPSPGGDVEAPAPLSMCTSPPPSPPASQPPFGQPFGRPAWLASTISGLVEFVDGPQPEPLADKPHRHHRHHGHHGHGRDGHGHGRHHRSSHARRPASVATADYDEEAAEVVEAVETAGEASDEDAWRSPSAEEASAEPPRLTSPELRAHSGWSKDDELLHKRLLAVKSERRGEQLRRDERPPEPGHHRHHRHRHGALGQRHPGRSAHGSAHGGSPPLGGAFVPPRRAASVADPRGGAFGRWEDGISADEDEAAAWGSQHGADAHDRAEAYGTNAADWVGASEEGLLSTNTAANSAPTYSPAIRSTPKRALLGASADGEAADVRTLSATLREWDRPALNGSYLPALVSMADAPKAVALAALLPSRTLTSLTLRDCQLGERSALALGQLLSAGVPLQQLDLRGNAIGERGLAAVAHGIQRESFLEDLKLTHAMPHPFSPPAVDALAAAAARCGAMLSIELGEVDAAAAGSGGPLARLQRALLLNVEDRAAATIPAMAWGHKPRPKDATRPSPPPSPPSAESVAASAAKSKPAPAPTAMAAKPRAPSHVPASVAVAPSYARAAAGRFHSSTDDGLDGVLEALTHGQLRTLKLTHEAAAARAPLPRQLDLLRAFLDCRTLRVAQLVNIGLGDAWAYALAAAMPRIRALRILDVSYNHIGSSAAKAIASALPSNHSLLWCQVLPQWLPLERDAELALGAALSPRRIKLDLTVRAARGVLSSRGDVGEPSVAFEWRGAVMSTGAASPACTLNPSWGEHFTLSIPASVLWPPSRTPLTLRLVDLRRSAQLTSDLPMATCELPLGALLLADECLGVRCALSRHANAAPVASRGAAELLLDLSTLHVGHKHPDDEAPGVPLAWRHLLTKERRAEFHAATMLQAGWRGRSGRGYAGGRRKLFAELGGLTDVADAALAERAGGRLCLALRRCPRSFCRQASHLGREAARWCGVHSGPVLTGLRARAYDAYHNFGARSASAPAAAHLLPQSVERSDEPEDYLSRQRSLWNANAAAPPPSAEEPTPKAAASAPTSAASKPSTGGGASASDMAKRRQQLLRLALCLLGSSVVVLGTGGVAMLLVLL